MVNYFKMKHPYKNLVSKNFWRSAVGDKENHLDQIYTKKGYFVSGKLKSSGYQLGGERDYI